MRDGKAESASRRNSSGVMDDKTSGGDLLYSDATTYSPDYTERISTKSLTINSRELSFSPVARLSAGQQAVPPFGVENPKGQELDDDDDAHNSYEPVNSSVAATLLRAKLSLHRALYQIKFQLGCGLHSAGRALAHSKMKRPPSGSAKTYAVIGATVMSWYAISLALTAANKILLDSFAFPYPIFVTFTHFTGVSLLTRTIVNFCRARQTVTVDPSVYVTTMLPIAFFTAAEVALTNQAYSMVSISVMTVVKSTLLAATYAVSILFRLERFRFDLMVILLWIIASVALSVPGMEVENKWGILILAVAIVFAAFRWTLIHKELQLSSLKVMTPLDLITVVQPLSALCLLPAAVVCDIPDILENMVVEPRDSERLSAILVLLAGATGLVCCLLFCEFKLVEKTSSLSLTVAGVGKECATVAMSRFLFKEALQPKAVVGLVSSILGITAYGYLRHAIVDETRNKPIDRQKEDLPL